MILLDSNTVIHYFRGFESVIRRFQMTARRELRIPSIVAYEVEFGALQTGSARRRTVSTRNAGSLRRPRCGTGARYGQSVSTRRRSCGVIRAASRTASALGNVSTPPKLK